MPVLNALPYLDEAVRSILSQSYADFEFVIYDDGSTDGSRERLQYWAAQDDRIRLILGTGPSGPVSSSNAVIAEAKGALIARMDADDISEPRRLEEQVQVMASDPDAVAVGALALTIDGRGSIVRPADLAAVLRPSQVAPFAHSTLLMRRASFERVGGYRPQAEKWEDLDLLDRLRVLGKVSIVLQQLGRVRLSSVSSRLRAERDEVDRAMGRMLGTLQYRNHRSMRLRPAAFVFTGSLDVWQGKRPGVLKRILFTSDLRFDLESITVILWAALAEVSPVTLRKLLLTRIKLRNAISTRRCQKKDAFEWLGPCP